MATVRAENRRLQRQLDAKPKTPLEESEENVLKSTRGHRWVAAFRGYAQRHGGQYPSSFDQAVSFLPSEAKAQSDGAAEEFEILYHGTRDGMTNFADGIVLREKQPRLASDGKWLRVYGFADGTAQLRSSADGNFDAYEQQHLVAPPSP